jgi:hypothetical protein
VITAEQHRLSVPFARPYAVHQIVAPFGRAFALPHERLQFDQSGSFTQLHTRKLSHSVP